MIKVYDEKGKETLTIYKDGSMKINGHVTFTNGKLELKECDILQFEFDDDEESVKQPITADKDDTAELTKAGLAILGKGETILSKKDADKLMESAERIGKKLKDQTVNLTINVDNITGNETDINKLASKIEELILKNGFSRQ